MKIMGVVLTLAILAGLLVMAVPVSAAPLAWTNVTLPQVTENTTANMFVIANDGKTIFLYDNNINTANSKLWKSGDAGYTWISTGVDTGSTKLATKTIKFLAIDPANSSNLLAATATDIYRSTNAGYSFSAYNPTNNGLGANKVITSIDLITSTDGLAYLVSYADTTAPGGGVAYYNPAEGAWFATYETGANKLSATAAWAGNAYAAVFSPNFASDSAIVAIAGNGTTITARTLLLNAGNAWNSDVVDVAITMANSTANTLASIAFPSDYTTTGSASKFFVGLGDVTATNVGVYRIQPKAGTASRSVLLDASPNAYSMDYKGTSSSGTLAVGQ